MWKFIAVVIMIITVGCLIGSCQPSKFIDAEIYNSDAVLLEANMENRINQTEGGPNLMSIQKWTVMYNGTVTYVHETGHGSETKTVENAFDINDVEKIAELMEKQKATKNDKFIEDFEYWNFQYYNKNNQNVKSFDGFIDNYDNLIELSEMLKNVVEK